MIKHKNLTLLSYSFVGLLVIVIICLNCTFNLTGMLGLSISWANRLCDAIYNGLAFWQIASLLSGAGIFGLGTAGMVWGAKWMIRQLGKKTFVGF